MYVQKITMEKMFMVYGKKEIIIARQRRRI